MRGIAKIFGAKGIAYTLGTIYSTDPDTPDNRVKMRSALFARYPRLHFFVIDNKIKTNYRNKCKAA